MFQLDRDNSTGSSHSLTNSYSLSGREAEPVSRRLFVLFGSPGQIEAAITQWRTAGYTATNGIKGASGQLAIEFQFSLLPVRHYPVEEP